MIHGHHIKWIKQAQPDIQSNFRVIYNLSDSSIYVRESPNYLPDSFIYVRERPIYLPDSFIYVRERPNYLPNSSIYVRESPNYLPESPLLFKTTCIIKLKTKDTARLSLRFSRRHPIWPL